MNRADLFELADMLKAQRVSRLDELATLDEVIARVDGWHDEALRVEEYQTRMRALQDEWKTLT